MYLWLLRPIDPKSVPWSPWFDKAFGFVIRAATEDEARAEAASNAGDEGAAAWKSARLSSCVHLTCKGDTEIVMQDFASA